SAPPGEAGGTAPPPRPVRGRSARRRTCPRQRAPAPAPAPAPARRPCACSPPGCRPAVPPPRALALPAAAAPTDWGSSSLAQLGDAQRAPPPPRRPQPLAVPVLVGRARVPPAMPLGFGLLAHLDLYEGVTHHPARLPQNIRL